ncbi:MAG: CRISPR-associated endonuclease Cas1 [Pirellulaceae bacterium]|jgi:CRISPR-associated protein Cas1|uniref:CRISPR-associated endonuclease Cas1 n=1 Tax=Caldilinea sp. TaxID=2293560 RepID=UPI0021DDA3F7|nr:CRISPR-associated endonuclease Cas1 [uncultured Caldilinea sp.]GIW89759.1 MAG: CRISPR-associated endonuclease Cas1 [Pirellulaceae bacterium]
MRNPLYVIEQGAKLNREGRRIIVSKDGETLAQVATLQISQVVLFGNVQVTTQALRLLLDEGVEVVLLSEDGRFYGRLVGAESGHGALRVNQVLCSQDANFALRTAQQMVYGKLHNIKMFLERQAQRLNSETVHLAAAGVEHQLRRTLRTTTHNSLMGVEGQGTAIYFGVWKALLQPPWRFEGRVRRPPTDPVNVLLSYGYTVLLQNVLGAVLTVGLDPYVGFLHRLEYNRPSLALDLMEEFRPLIVDSVVLHCLNDGVIKEEHFRPGESEERPILLAPEGVRLFVRELEARLTQSFKHPESGEQVTYRRLFHLQAYALARSLDPTGAAPAYRPFLAR